SVFLWHRRAGYRLDLLHAAQQRLFEFRGYSRRDRHLHQWLLFDSHGPELHRHHPHHARARNDLVPAPALRLGPLRHQHHLHFVYAGHRDHASPCRHRAYVSPRLFPPADGLRAPPRSTASVGPPRYTKVSSPGTRPCSMPSASLACLPLADSPGSFSPARARTLTPPTPTLAVPPSTTSRLAVRSWVTS